MTFTRRGLGAVLVGALFGRKTLPASKKSLAGLEELLLCYRRRQLARLMKKFSFTKPLESAGTVQWFRYSNLQEPSKDA